MVSSSPVVGRRIGRRFGIGSSRTLLVVGDFRRANQGGRGRARTDGDHHVIGGVKVQGVYGTLVVAEEATGHHRPDGLMVQDNHRERACFAPDIMNLSGRMGLHSTERTDKNTAESFRRGTTLSVGPREGDAWAMLGDSAFTQSSYYIARLRVYILTVCSASKGWADKRAGREASRVPSEPFGSLAQRFVVDQRLAIEAIPCSLLVLLLADAVGAADDGVVSLVGLQGELLRGLELFLLQLLDLPGEHSLGGP